MYAIITRDMLNTGRYQADSIEGKVVLDDGTRPVPEDELLTVRLLDDDREAYYVARADAESLETLYEWAYRDVGVTILQVKKHGVWVDEIG